MKLAASLFSIAGLTTCLLATTSAQAELYKSIGPNGQVTYSDTPPASGAVINKKSLATNSGGEAGELPYELAQAKKNSPVTLYTSSKCIPCDDGRKLLNSRGVPFSEKTVTSNNDIARLKEVSGEGQLPLLMIGRSKESGFEAGAWNAALSAAGYPQNNQLPKTYRNGQTSAAAPTATEEKANAAPANAPNNVNSGAPLPAAGNAPPGFRF